MRAKGADASPVGKKGKGKPVLGPATVVRPALLGAGALVVIDVALKAFLKG